MYMDGWEWVYHVGTISKTRGSGKKKQFTDWVKITHTWS